jgi:DNA-binding beta-propeller fold protein YncE
MVRGLSDPTDLAVDGLNLFVAELGNPFGSGFGGRGFTAPKAVGGAVAELRASSGATVRVLKGPAYPSPERLALAGTDLFVLNFPAPGKGSVAELDTGSGALVRVLSTSRDGFIGPVAMAVDQGRLFVLDADGDRGAGGVLEFSVSTGALVRAFGGPGYKFYPPLAMVADGPHLFVAGTGGLLGGGAVTEVDAARGHLLKVISGQRYNFGSPTAIALDGPDLFVVDRALSVGPPKPGSLTEVNASTGALVRVLSGPQYHFYDALHVLADGPQVFVGSVGLPGGRRAGVTELDAATGTVMHVFTTPIVNPTAMATDGPWLYVADGASGTVVRVSTLP